MKYFNPRLFRFSKVKIKHFQSDFSLSLEIARVLLENGADPNARNRFGATPLFEASQVLWQMYLELA
jgi:ankyrin repeat protein